MITLKEWVRLWVTYLTRNRRPRPAPEPEPAPPPEPTPPGPLPLEDWRAELTRLHNEARLTPLTRSDELEEAATAHAEWMTRNRMTHTGDRQGGVRPADRARKAGYAGGGVGENIAYGPKAPRGVFDMWMGSSGHHRNILAPYYDEIGVGYARNDRGTVYWCVKFGNADPMYGLTYGDPEDHVLNPPPLGPDGRQIP